MSTTLLVLAVAALASVAFLVSGAVGGVLLVMRSVLGRLAPKAQARVLLVATLLPLLVSVAMLVAALSPSFGWIGDHCEPFGSQHSHPHICVAHHTVAWPAVSILAIGGYFALRLGGALLSSLAAATLRVTGAGKLRALSHSAPGTGPAILPLDDAQAFSIGLIRPTIFVTAGLMRRCPEHLDAVLAHEQAHVRRRDAVWRELARPALAFHAPGIARALQRSLVRAQEMAADELAAEQVGSRSRVAKALVDLARAQRQVPSAVSFAGSDVEARVASLLREEAGLDTPSRPTVMATVTAALGAIGAFAGAVHHGVEILLGLLGA